MRFYRYDASDRLSAVMDKENLLMAALYDGNGTNTDANRFSWKSFWYGSLCQGADIFLPAPTAFKAWLHEKMGLRDEIDVLFEREVYEADLSCGAVNIQEAACPTAMA